MVSVVVIGRNEGARLVRCLESVAAMVREFELEVIYVDSGSRDDSVQAAAGLGAKVIALDAARPTAAIGRNAGWRAARGEIVLFLDGDTVLDSRFVAESLGEFADATVAVVWGHRREMLPWASAYNRVLDLDWIYAAGDTTFCGGDALFRRDVLETTGGFDELLIAGEEPELCQRILALDYRILHVDRAMTGHDLAMTRFGQYWRRAMRAGHAYGEVSERFAGTENPFWMADARRNRTRFWAIFWSVVSAVGYSVYLGNMWPFLIIAGGWAGLWARTVWFARWKTDDWVTLGMYGVHSHLQQIPIYCGQVGFWWSKKRGKRVGLVEYRG